MADPTTTDLYLNKIKNNKPIARIIIAAIVLTGISAFISQIDSGYQVVKKNFETTFSSTKNAQIDCQNCKEIYNSGLTDIVNDRFLEPPENNLLSKIEELNKKDIKAAQDLITNASNTLHQRISESIGNNPSIARKYLSILSKISPADPKIPIYERNLRELSEQQKKTRDSAKKETTSKQQAKTQPQDRPLAPSSAVNPLSLAPSPNKLEEKKAESTINGASEISSNPPDSGTGQGNESRTTSDRIVAICFAASNAYGDSSKVRILDTALRPIQEITSAQAVQLFTCTDIYSDSSLIDSLKAITSKKIKGRISSADVKRILNEIYSDSSKSIAIEILTPFM